MGVKFRFHEVKSMEHVSNSEQQKHRHVPWIIRWHIYSIKKTYDKYVRKYLTVSGIKNATYFKWFNSIENMFNTYLAFPPYLYCEWRI